MNTRRVLLLLLAISIPAVATACGGGTANGPSVNASTTSLQLTVAPTAGVRVTPRLMSTPRYAGQSAAQMSVGYAMDVYYECPPYCAQYGAIQSMEYVETTVGQLRQVFGAELQQTGSDNKRPAWAVVAHGNFSGWCMGCMPHEYYVGKNFWVLGLKNSGHMAAFGTDEDHDIRQLGSPLQVAIPLPPWPTPVVLETPSR